MQHRWTGGQVSPSLLHLVVRRLSASRCASSSSASSSRCSRSGTELRQPPPAQHQQVNQRSQPHQHRHGHRQLPTETLHFPVRRSRRRPQPGLCQNPIFQERETNGTSSVQSQSLTAQVRPVPPTVRRWLRCGALPHARSLPTHGSSSDTPDGRGGVHACRCACMSVCDSVNVWLRESWTPLEVWMESMQLHLPTPPHHPRKVRRRR